MERKKLKEIAHSRAGDKGKLTTISVIAYEDALYEAMKEAVTAERVEQHFKDIADGGVYRYELPQLKALNFVIEGTKPSGSITRL